MTYMIKISQTGEPKLVIVPEKREYFVEHCYQEQWGVYYTVDNVHKTAFQGTERECRIFVDDEENDYLERFNVDIADNDKHFKFKEPLLILRILLDFVDYAPDNFVKKKSESYIGQSFPLPTGWRVEFEYYYLGDNEYFKKDEPEENKWVGPVGKSIHDIHLMMGWKTKAVAVLLPEQPEESQKHDCTDYAKINCTCPKGICRYHDRRSKVEQPEEKKELVTERIICSAMQLESGKVYYGHRHPHCIEAANGELSWELSRKQISEIKKIQGFVTNTGRFVDRIEGARIWLAQDSTNKLSYSTEELYSEDLY